jgi:drug/metabolite transporter (DMT)-like permease
VLEALSFFGINYIFVYMAEEHLTSGLVAVIFALLAFLNLVLMRLFYRTPIPPRHAAGAAIGIVGIVLVFWPEVARFSGAGGELLGLAYGIAAVLTASLGNIVATRNQRAGMPIVQGHGWAMLYAAVAVALYAVLTGDPLSFDWSPSYVASLLYLALFGSALAFGAYVTLMGRIGLGRVGYTAIAVPVVALLLSTLFENLQWRFEMVIGIVLCLAGNWLVLAPRKP